MPRDLYQSSEAPAAGSEEDVGTCSSLVTSFQLTEISRVDGIEDCPMDPVEGVTGVDGQLLDLLPVLGVRAVVVSVGPQPQLGEREEEEEEDWYLRVGVEAVSQHRERIQGEDEVTDVLRLNLNKCDGDRSLLVVPDRRPQYHSKPRSRGRS